jgi:hypothetical protein
MPEICLGLAKTAKINAKACLKHGFSNHGASFE